MNITTLRLKSIGLGLAALFAVLVIQVVGANPTFAAPQTWDGSAADGKFSTAANWASNSVPVNGDTLTFPGGTTAPYTLDNDLNATVKFGNVTVSGAQSYIINDLTLQTGTVAVTSTGTLNVTSGLASDGALTLNGQNKLTIGSLTVSSGDLTVSSQFAATTANLAASAILSSIFSVTNTLTVGGALTVNQNITVGALDVGTNLVISSNFTATNGITVGGNLTMSGSPVITTTGGAIAVTGTANIAGTFAGSPAPSIDVTSTLTVSTDFTAVSTSASDFIINSNFHGGAIVSYLDFTTGAFTVNATTLSLPHASTLTVSNGGSIIAATSVAVGDAALDTAAKITAVAGSTINTPSITIQGNAANASTLAGTLTGTPAINLPNGSLTLSSASTVGAVTVANVLTASNFTAASVTTDTITISGAFTVSGTLLVASTTVPLTIATNITVGTLDARDSLTITSAFTVTTVLVTDTLTVNNASFSATTVTAGSLTASTAFNVTGTLTVSNALTIGKPVTVGTLTALGGLTISSGSNVYPSKFTASTAVNVTGALSVATDYSAPVVTVSGNTTLTGFEQTPHQYVLTGTLTLGNDSTNTYVVVDNNTSVTGAVTVTANARLDQDDLAVVSFGSLTVKNDASVLLYGDVSYPVTFGSGKSTSAPSVGYNSFTAISSVYNTLRFTGPVVLLNDLEVYITGNATSGKIEFAGTLTQNTFSIRKQVSTSGVLVIGGVEVRNPVTTNEYNGVQPSTPVSVGDNEIATISGTRGTVTAYRGGFVKGTGQVVNLNLQYGSAVSPGNSPGKLTVLNTVTFVTGSTYYAEIQSTSAFDQLAVGEEYTLLGNPIVLGNATLNVTLSSGYKIAQGDKFTIIDNKSSRPVSGTFLNQAEGSVFSVGDGTFSISYVGGDGNDVVLTTVSAPSQPVQAPNTGFRLLTSNPALLLGLGVVTAGFFLVMASRRRANSTL